MIKTLRASAKKGLLLVPLVAAGYCTPALATTSNGWSSFKIGQGFGNQQPKDTWVLKGYARAAYDNTHYENILEPRRSYGIGGGIGIESPQYHGFSIGLEGYAVAAPFAGNSSDANRNIVTLVGSQTNGYASLGKAYLRYTANGIDIKAGRIAIKTPLASSVDRRIVPVLFQGISGSYQTGIDGLSLYGARINRIKRYQLRHFTDGDSGNGVDGWNKTPGAFSPSVDSSGFFATGMAYRHQDLDSKLWFYNMYERLKVVYGDATVKLPYKLHGMTPFVGVQYGHEWNDSSAASYYENVKSDLYGIKLGIGNRYDTIQIQSVYVPGNDGHFKGGGFTSPYQRNAYDASPLFTNQPILNLTEQPGLAVGIKNIVHTKDLVFITGLTHVRFDKARDYHGVKMAQKDSNGAYFIVDYKPGQAWELSWLASYIKTDTVIGHVFASRINATYHFGD